MTMKYETGQSKPIGDVTLDDMLKYPIWIFAIDEEGEEDQDETWQKPITNSTNVGKELFEAYILLNEKSTGSYFSACISIKKLDLYDICIWNSDSASWTPINECNFSYPIHLFSIPSINGKKNMDFIITKVQ